MVDQIEKQLGDSQWLSGEQPGEADKEAIKVIGNNVPNVTIYPHTFAWYSLASRFKWAQDILKDAPPAVKKPSVQIMKPAPASTGQTKPAQAKPAQADGAKESKKEQKKEQPAKEQAAEGEEGKKPSKKGDKKAAKEAAKAAKAAEVAKKLAEQNKFVKDENDICAHLFGDLALNQSDCDPEIRFTKKYAVLGEIGKKQEGKEVRIRGRLHRSNCKGTANFLYIRQGTESIQCCAFVDDKTISKHMAKYMSKIPRESIVEIVGKPQKPAQEIQGCTNKAVEIHITQVWTVNKSANVLPFQIEDASRQVLNQEEEGNAPTKDAKEDKKKKGDKEEKKEEKLPVVKQDVRLDARIIDLRVPTNNAIFRLQSGVCQIYREFFYSKDFVEIHTPKLQAGSSEGGCEVFTLKYFDRPACLAQSPQLYKQMAICGDLKRVIEIGPVFRAENSFTNRHLCEFTGLDMEMEFNDHYFEVLDILGEMMVYLTKNLKKRYAKELAVINEQYPFEEFKIAEPIVKIDFQDGVKMLREAGIEQGELDDLSTETEKALGNIVKEKYDTDFYILYGFPTDVRAFYSMPNPKDPRYSNSFDLFMRGQEITSGAQRIHDPELLAKQAAKKGIAVETIKDYVDAFKFGAPNHGGAGFGLERIVKFFCNLHNIRKTSLFPRDPQRLSP